MEDHIDTIQNELVEARRNLHQTVADLHSKVEAVSERFVPEHVLKRHLLLAACMAGIVGLVAGNHGGKPAAATLVLGALFGAVLQEAANHEFPNRDAKPRT
jgi:hypothetical protein